MMELIAEAERLAIEELERANEKFPPFASDHEGYAVICEEIEEACDEIDAAAEELDKTWKAIKADDQKAACVAIIKTRKALLRGISEMVQSAAMCEKFIQSQEARK